MINKIISKINFLIRITFSKTYFYRYARSQNNNEENRFLKKISKNIKYKNFTEIGFHNTEFNCIGLIEKNFSGLLIDSGRSLNLQIMKLILFLIGKSQKIKVENLHVEKKNVRNIFRDKHRVGLISIDIDGNDFWIVKKILEIGVRPNLFIVEYNPSFLKFSLSVPYIKNFNRFERHPSGLYHGASLRAFEKLFKKYDYRLIRVIGGINAVFSSKKIAIYNNLKTLNTNNSYKEGVIRNKIYKQNAKKQFQTIKHLKLIRI